jgi:hypothetical protein
VRAPPRWLASSFPRFSVPELRAPPQSL